MARTRKFQPTPQIRHEIRSGVKAGHSQEQIYNDIRERYPRVNLTSLRGQIRQEEVRNDNVKAITGANRGRFGNLGRLAGCDDPKATVRLRFVITVTNPQTGERQHFGHTVDATGGGRIGDILGRSIDQIRSEATDRGYIVGSVLEVLGDPNFDITLEYAECI